MSASKLQTNLPGLLDTAWAYCLENARSLSLSCLSIFTGLAIWKALSITEMVSPLVLPPPETVWSEFLRLSSGGELWPNYWISLLRMAEGLGIAIVIGVPLGLLMGMSRVAKGLVNPIIELYRPLPAISYFTFLVLWFGLGESAIIAVLALGGLPPIVLETVNAVSRVRRDRLECGRSMGLSNRQIMVEIILPSCLPDIATGIRVGLGLAYSVVVAAEMVASTSGLGWMVYNASQFVETSTVIVGLVLMGLTGLILDTAVAALKYKFMPWFRYV
jgi:taurine transport system permease protein